MSDVVIVGGGPAGLTLGCYLARAGMSPLIVERAVHPRAHVGESLMPATIRILREIGFIDVVEGSDFVRSYGVAYHPREGRQVDIAYREFPQEGVLQDHSYHAERSRFDLMLMKYAEGLGCRILSGAQVREVVFEGERATGVLVDAGGHDLRVPADLVVDASGRAALLGHQLEMRTPNRELDQFALHGWFTGVDRGKRRTSSYTHVFFLEGPRQWAWQVPVTEDMTSIGVVSDRAAFRASGMEVEDFFSESMRTSPALAKAVRGADPIYGIKGEVNYSYEVERLCGDGWLILGDAARFVDPVFSSGVFVAMQSAQLASVRILEGAEAGDFSRERLVPYEERMKGGAAILDEFIRLFYRLLPAFIHFVQSDDHRLGVLRLLQGEVYNRNEAPVLAEIRRFVETVERLAAT
jgi:flavin-dependent dehydrogenase